MVPAGKHVSGLFIPNGISSHAAQLSFKIPVQAGWISIFFPKKMTHQVDILPGGNPMKKSVTTIALTLFLSPLLMQCAAEKDVRGIDMRLRATDSKITEMDTIVSAIQNQRGSQAELSNRLEQLKSRVLQLEARLEEKSIQTRKLQEEQALLKQKTNSQIEQLHIQVTELNNKISGVTAKITSVSGDFSRIQEDRAKEAAERAASAAKAAEEARKKVEAASASRVIEPEEVKKKPVKPEKAAKPVAETATVRDAETNTSDSVYNKGLAAYKANNYKEAYNLFSSYLEKNRTSPLAPNARFWLGECLFQQKEFELSILEYQKVIADYPKSNKAPAALYKQGQAFEKLSEKETAKIIYNKLLSDYPKSEQVEMAQKRLKEMK